MPTVRKRPLRSFSLSPEAFDRIGRLAARWGMTRSATVERLAREAKLPRELSARTQARA
jgi:hypothetical protein